MSTGTTLDSKAERRIRRTAVIGSIIGLILAYSVLIPMRAVNLTEPYLNWPIVLIYPPTMFGWLVGIVITGTMSRRHSFAWIMGLTAIEFGIVLAVAAFSGFLR